VAELLHKNEATVYRWEDGHSLCTADALQTLLLYYRATGTERADAERRWEWANEKPAKFDLPSRHRRSAAFMSSEADAATISSLHLVLLPGLFQTARYAEAIIRAGHRFNAPDIDTHRHVSARMARQRRLDGPDAVRLRSYLDEAAVRRVVGGREVMVEQLHRLLKLGAQDNVSIRIIPYRAGEYGSMVGNISMHEFAELGDTPAIYLEHEGHTVPVEDAESARSFARMFEDLDGIALPEADSAELIRRQLTTVETT
jgi:hypothetical protein